MISSFRLQHLVRSLAVAAALAIPAAALSPVALAHDYKVGDITVDHPWARATPHGAKVAGGFLVLENKGGTPDRLVSAAAEIAEHTEIHEMAMKDGVMSMRQLPEGLAVPAGGEVALKPGGYHLMFIDLKRPLAKGESFKGTLTFEKAGSVEVSFTVDAIAAGGTGHH